MIHPAQRHEKVNDDGRRGGQPSDRQLALDHGAHAHRKRMLLRQHQRRPAKMIRPVTHLLLLDRANVELRPLRKVQRTELDDTVLLRTVRDMDSLIDRKTVDLPVLVVNVGTERQDSVRTEYLTVRVSMECDS